ncbi:calcium calmodulin-dependent kinase [Fusarium albosuccineum]|uniref:non-specific serine/threonine protein kinase n=1 Tax=Fusarium albosuccineum TaxID=1237068 RepID=A0A8H4LDX9_9HYPO|nr:calcium calmodulin-dependent kinase [Fusarium albosuccineum]
MARRKRNGGDKPTLLFYLVPQGQLAREVIEDQRNENLVSFFVDHKGQELRGIGVYFNPNLQAGLDPHIMGKNAQIKVNSPFISNQHCRFEINTESGEIMLRDLSKSEGVRIDGPKATGFLKHPHPRRVVVAHDANLEFTLGYSSGFRIRWKIVWMKKPRIDLAAWKLAWRGFPGVAVPPEERSYPGPKKFTESSTEMIRYIKRGNFIPQRPWKMFGAVDIGTGQRVMVRKVNLPTRPQPQKRMLDMARACSEFTHDHIVEFVQFRDMGSTLDVIMGREQGSLLELVDGGIFNKVPEEDMLNAKDQDGNPTLFRQMLDALEYLECQNIMHRNVKPTSILYTQDEWGYCHYRLANFKYAERYPGSDEQVPRLGFAAPEASGRKKSGLHQSPKMDVWALCETMVYVLDPTFRQKCRSNMSKERLRQELFRFSQARPQLLNMAMDDPDDRPFASKRLDELLEVLPSESDYDGYDDDDEDYSESEDEEEGEEEEEEDDVDKLLAERLTAMNIGSDDEESDASADASDTCSTHSSEEFPENESEDEDKISWEGY